MYGEGHSDFVRQAVRTLYPHTPHHTIPLGDVGHVADEVDAHGVHHLAHDARRAHAAQVRRLLKQQAPVVRLGRAGLARGAKGWSLGGRA